jgi:hypothetical protein
MLPSNRPVGERGGQLAGAGRARTGRRGEGVQERDLLGRGARPWREARRVVFSTPTIPR